MADDVVAKALPPDPLLEIGATGLEHSGGVIRNDFLRALEGG